jgi:hypothetical protein
MSAVAAHELVVAGAIGAGATLLMDLWNLFLGRAFAVRSLDYCLLGRWVAHMQVGTLRHASIAEAAPRRGECRLGWLTHYGIGVTLAVGFVALSGGEWLGRPDLRSSVLFGWVTVAFPLLVLQPAMGLGVAASKMARPARARLKSFVTHTIFGIGLYLAAMLVQWMGRTTR